jgi:putative transposase
MLRNFYSEINLHIVWHTKNNSPLLTPTIEPLAHRALRKRIVDTPGAFVHEIGGVEDRVHLAVTIVPTIEISRWIGELKGGTSHDINHKAANRQAVLQWQAGYGVVSFGTGDLDWVVKYIRHQREHHRRGSVVDRLERITQLEQDSPDATAEATWREAP